MSKSKKGTVAIQSVKGRLRLCWTYNRRRYFLALLLDDTKLNRATAQMVAARIEEDIRTQNFDESLNKYRPVECRQGEIGALTLFDRFIRFKASRASVPTVSKYRGLQKTLAEYLGADRSVTPRDAAAFLDWYSKRVRPITLAARCGNFATVWDWGIEQGLVQSNPWRQARKTLPKVPAPQPKPFSENEIKRILELFRSDSRLQHYADFVEFRLRTGCRSGEVAGLRWGHLNHDCSAIRISESMVRGKRQSTKTGEEREFLLSKPIQELLLRRKLDECNPDDLIFTTKNGGVIYASNFSEQYWKPALKELNIPYRKPYNTRATFASHALYKGVSPAEVAEITGHSQDVLFRHYSGVIQRSKLPDLWD
ncbi:tyrosine-type recombinase/integrase [Pantanalinema sp. GBBB05]|uniref:tyrosine-type recombinase/integrase n=1 Tax=Pantanalinema sp. GBBB05 TaxID=2604139 RepID=UPI001D99F5CA|nr:tyrosine-type recombinase/integrase [Pantanalinema sp. GBBB05]